MVTLPLLAFSCQAQGELTSTNKKAIKSYNKALEYYNVKNSAGAVKELSLSVAADPAFIEAHMLMGYAYEDLKDKDKALASLKRAIEINPNYYPEVFANAGKLEFHMGKYEDAVGHFEAYLNHPKKKTDLAKVAEHYLASSKFAVKAKAEPVPFKPENLGPNINTQYDEYLPTLTADEQTLIITRREPSLDIQAISGNVEAEDFYVSRKVDGKWKLAENLGQPVNTVGNEGAQCISADGQFLIFTGCERSDGRGSCDLYAAQWMGKDWSKPINLRGLNSTAWDSQPSLSSDGKTLYFASTRKGGRGGVDIWKSNLEGKRWGSPVPVVELNTNKNEMSPFMHPDNQTLYFASDGHIGLGSYDLFVARKDKNGVFSEIKNMGYPINTHGEETSLIVSASGETGYFASSERKDVIGRIDLYSFPLYEEARPKKITYVKGQVYDATTKMPLEALFELIDLDTGAIVMESVSNKANGEFLVVLPVGKEYALNVSKDGYMFFSENFKIPDATSAAKPFLMNVPMNPVGTGSVVLKNIFFNTGEYDLLPASNVELGKLHKFLEANPDMRIEISGHTDDVGEDKANQILSENRANAVFTYLVDRGVEESRMTYKGFGETAPIEKNETPEGRQKNRRTEFRVMTEDEYPMDDSEGEE